MSEELTPGAEVTNDFLENLETLNLEPQDGYIDGETPRPKDNTEQVSETEPKQTDKTEAKEGNAESETVEDIDKLFDFNTEDASGSKTLDTEKASEFFKPKEVKIESPIAVQEPLKKEEPTYEDTLTKNLTYGINRIKEYVEAGHDHQTAILLANRDIEDDIREHLRERRFNESLESVNKEKEEIRQNAQLESMRPKSIANLTESVRAHGWKTSDKLNAALLHKDLSGPLLETFHKLANPDKKYNSVQEYTDSLQESLVKFTADKNTLLMLEEFARARIYMRNKPAIVNKIRSAKEKTDRDNEAANVSGNQARHRNEPGVKTSNAINDWIKNEGIYKRS